MNSQPNYEQMYHLMNQRRGEEFKQLQGLVTTFEETDRMVAGFAESEVIPFPAAPDQRISDFLTRLDSRDKLKRFKDTCHMLEIMLREGDKLTNLTEIYREAAKGVGYTTSSLDRSLRAFRAGVQEMNTDFYQKKLAKLDMDCFVFIWNIARLLKEELDQPPTE